MTINYQKDYYKILSVSPKAKKEDIEKMYRKLSQAFHPDNFVNCDEETKRLNEEKAKELNEARAVLCDEEARKSYDINRNVGRSSSQYNSSSSNANSGYNDISIRLYAKRCCYDWVNKYKEVQKQKTETNKIINEYNRNVKNEKKAKIIIWIIGLIVYVVLVVIGLSTKH